MSIDTNDAPRIVQYLNAQLQAVWKKARDAARRLGRGTIPLKSRQAIAPVTYSLEEQVGDNTGATGQQKFEIQLDSPKLDLVCKHSAVLKLNVTKACFTHADSRSEEVIPKSEITFKMGYQMKDVVVEGKRARTFDLDYPNARLVHISPPVERGLETFEMHLRRYLSFLHSGKHSTLFCPVAPNDESRSSVVDFMRSSSTPPAAVSVHGMPMDHINRTICKSWLMTSTMPRFQDGKAIDSTTLSLRTWKGTTAIEGKEVLYNMTFGAPELVAPCEREAGIIIYFDIAEVTFYKDRESAPFEIFCDWTVAVLMDAKREDKEGDSGIKCTLDIKTCHFMPQLSLFPGCLPTDNEAIECKARIIDIICGEYLRALERAGHLAFNHSALCCADPKPNGFVSEDISTVPRLRDTQQLPARPLTPAAAIPWRELSQRTDMAGFDQVNALTETSINERLDSLWQQPHAGPDAENEGFPVDWSHSELFSATFGAPIVQLVQERKAVLRIPLKSGSVMPIRSQMVASRNVDRFHFADWTVGFTVDLKLCDHAAVPGVDAKWRSNFASSHSTWNDVSFNHLYMDLQHADFNLDCSDFAGLSTANDKGSIDKAHAAVIYVRDHYLKDLASAGYHILASIPVSRAPSKHPGVLTSATFFVDAKDAPNVPFDENSLSESSVQIAGMHLGKPLPSPLPHHLGTWVTNIPTPSQGTLALSASSFLHAYLLPALSEVNARTRVEPVSQDASGVTLVRWCHHPRRVTGDCRFKPVVSPISSEEPLQFRWSMGRRFNMEKDESCFVRTETENYVDFPTTPNLDDLDIVLWGSVNLELADKGWNSKASAKWETLVKVKFEGDRLHVSTDPRPIVYSTASPHGQPQTVVAHDSTKDLLKKVLQDSVQIRGLEQAFQPLEAALKAYSADHPGCHFVDPVFNHQGDLLVQISSQARLPEPEPEDQVAPVKITVSSYDPQVETLYEPGVQRPRGARPLPSTLTHPSVSALPIHKSSLSSAGVQRQPSEEDSSTSSGSPLAESIFSPTRGPAQRGSKHYTTLEVNVGDEGLPVTPASSVSPSPMDKPNVKLPEIPAIIPALANPTVFPFHSSAHASSSSQSSSSRQMSTQPFPSMVGRMTASPTESQFDAPVVDEEDYFSQGSRGFSYEPQGEHRGRSMVSHIHEETRARPPSAVNVLYGSATKDTQSASGTLGQDYDLYASSSYPPRGGQARPVAGPPSVNMQSRPPTHQTPPAPINNPASRVPLPTITTTPPTRSNTVDTWPARQAISDARVPPSQPAVAPRAVPPPAAAPRAVPPPATAPRTVPPPALSPPARSESPRVPDSDPSVVYPRLKPDRHSAAVTQPLQPVDDAPLDLSTAAGRRALRAGFSAGRTSGLRAGQLDSAASANAMGVELHEDPRRLLPRESRAPAERTLTWTQQQKQLAGVERRLNQGIYY
ncbi:hypothetical protein PsYK624_129410 [Phanerochaete sordida]|uniref:Uncharacterized protein n=1 Tax=Phanerochaete sordida TaxID=48140 RepID=A0A9P3GNM3_9APHY|nr:hypothetical protein PsYK624_129410 [Phanerochaete sordida]